jgi:uncharacterized protein YggE
MDRTVRVTGSGSVQVAPDLAVLRVTAVHTAPAAVDALVGAASASGLAAERAREYVEARHVGTSGVDLWPAHDHEGRPRGFEARHALTLTCTDLDRVGPLLDALAGALGERLRVDGISLRVADPAAVRERAVQAAYDDARARAERLATLAGAGLGPVVSLIEDDGHGGGMFLAAGAVGKADLSIEPGETSVSASVTATWQLEV